MNRYRLEHREPLDFEIRVGCRVRVARKYIYDPERIYRYPRDPVNVLEKLTGIVTDESSDRWHVEWDGEGMGPHPYKYIVEKIPR